MNNVVYALTYFYSIPLFSTSVRFCVIYMVFSSILAKDYISPVILFPGQGGNRLEVKDTRFNKNASWELLWLDQWKLAKENKLFTEQMSLYFNKSINKFTPVPGIDIRVPEWGKMESVEYLDTDSWAKVLNLVNIGMSQYATPFIQGLIDIGYIRDETIMAAPYDFRLATSSQGEYFKKCRKIIETSYIMNQNRSVIIISHSMGGLMSYKFLTSMKAKWKKKYIHSYITLNVPWSGTVRALHSFTSGYNFDSRLLDPLLLRDMYRNFETSVETFPRAPAFRRNQILLKTPQFKVSISNMKTLFKALNCSHMYSNYRKAQKRFKELRHPKVNTYIMYSRGVNTEEKIIYKNNQFPNKLDMQQYGDGDGTVNLASLRAAHIWKRDRRYGKRFKVRSFSLQGVGHRQIIGSQDLLKLVMKLNDANR